MAEERDLKVKHNFLNLKEGKYIFSPASSSFILSSSLTCFLGQEYVMTLQDTSVLDENDAKASLLQNSDLRQEENL